MLLGFGLTAGAFSAGSAGAAEPAVGLGTAANFAVLGGSTVTNTGLSILDGFDLGVSPGTDVTGFPPGQVLLPGVQHKADATALQAQSDATTAFNDAARRTAAAADSGLTELGGKTLQPGVYQGDALSVTGTVTLNNNDVPDAVFILQASDTLTMSSSSAVRFTNADHPSCNVYWEVGSSATIGTGTSFVGTLLAHISVSAATGATIKGRLLAGVGAVTLDDNTITRLPCGLTTGGSSTTKPTPTSSAVVVPPPATSITPPRDVTSGSTASIIAPTTPSNSSTRKTPSTPSAAASSSAGTTDVSRPSTASKTLATASTGATLQQVAGTFSSDTTGSTERRGSAQVPYTAGSTSSAGATTVLALTGPPPIGGLTVIGLTTMLAGGVFLAFARSRRTPTGRHHRPAH